MRKLLEMCVGALGLVAGLLVVTGLFLAAGLLCLLVWAGESVARARDGESPEGL